MLSILFYVLAGLAFLLAGVNEPIFGQPQVDEIAFGLLFLVLAGLFTGIWRPAPWRSPPPA